VEKTTKRTGTTRRCIREECDYQEAVTAVEAEAEMEPVAKAG
jgi:hypothetical protein